MRVFPRTITEPLGEPVTLGQFRQQIRVDDNIEDALLYGYLAAARQLVERWTGRLLLPRAVRATFEVWPADPDRIEIAIPVTSVDAIAYTDATQTQTPWGSTLWLARTIIGVTRVRPAYGQTWPVLGNDPLITIDATAGYTVLPEPLATAILRLAGDFYLNREDVIVGTRLTSIEMPNDIAKLIGPYRWRLIS